MLTFYDKDYVTDCQEKALINHELEKNTNKISIL